MLEGTRYPLCCWEGSLLCAEADKFSPAKTTLGAVPPGKRSEEQQADLKMLKYH